MSSSSSSSDAAMERLHGSSSNSAATTEAASHGSGPVLHRVPSDETELSTPTSSLAPPPLPTVLPAPAVPNNTPATRSAATSSERTDEASSEGGPEAVLTRVMTAFDLNKLPTATTPSHRSRESAPRTPYTHESSTWADLAEDDLAQSLARVVQAAKDAHKLDPSKSVEQYYSETVGNALRNAEVEFDRKFLPKEHPE